jgi:DNA invertase Pin-like site-specific DNA recombinase
MQRTLAYARVSTEAQTQGNGLAQQRKEIVTYAAMNELQIDEWFVDAKTGTTEDREQLNRLKLLAEAGEIGTLILDRMDRLGRTTEVNLSLLRQFEEWGVKVVFVQQAFEAMPPPMRKFMQTIFAALAEMQKAELLQRMVVCKREAVARGKFIGGGIPLGYKTGSTPGELVIDESTAATVRLIFELKERGLTHTQISTLLNQRGILTRRGNDFYPSGVLHILNNRDFYAGHRTIHASQAKNIRPTHEPILRINVT